MFLNLIFLGKIDLLIFKLCVKYRQYKNKKNFKFNVVPRIHFSDILRNQNRILINNSLSVIRNMFLDF